jgi:hypothetical protein
MLITATSAQRTAGRGEIAGGRRETAHPFCVNGDDQPERRRGAAACPSLRRRRCLPGWRHALPAPARGTRCLPGPRRRRGAGFWRENQTRRENPGVAAAVTLSCLLVTEAPAPEAPAFSVVADVAIVKGETPAGDRTWLSFPDGTARREAVHVIHDLPHLVVESVFGLGDGLWGTLAAGGFEPARRAVTRRNARIRLVTDAAFDDLAARNWPAHAVAKAAVNAVLNRWGDGQDTPAGVRSRLRRAGPEAAELAGQLTDEEIRVASAGVRRLYREWAALPVGGTLRATWPLHDSWLRLL